MLLNVVYGPYDYGVQDRIETLSLATSFFTVLGGLFFQQTDKTGGEEKMNMVSVSVEVAVIINATVIVAMLTIVLKPIMSRCQQKRFCSCKRLIENLYPRAYCWQPKPPTRRRWPRRERRQERWLVHSGWRHHVERRMRTTRSS